MQKSSGHAGAFCCDKQVSVDHHVDEFHSVIVALVFQNASDFVDEVLDLLPDVMLHDTVQERIDLIKIFFHGITSFFVKSTETGNDFLLLY